MERGMGGPEASVFLIVAMEVEEVKMATLQAARDQGCSEKNVASIERFVAVLNFDAQHAIVMMFIV